MPLGHAVAHLFSSVSTGNDGADRVRKEREVPVICFSGVCAGNKAVWRTPVGEFCWRKTLPAKCKHVECKHVEC